MPFTYEHPTNTLSPTGIWAYAFLFLEKQWEGIDTERHIKGDQIDSTSLLSESITN